MVKFVANNTRLGHIHPLEVSDKAYPDSAMSLWAIERTNFSIKKYYHLWGLIDGKHKDKTEPMASHWLGT